MKPIMVLQSQQCSPLTKMATSYLNSLMSFYRLLVGVKEIHLESKPLPEESYCEKSILKELQDLRTEISLRDQSRNRIDDL